MFFFNLEYKSNLMWYFEGKFEVPTTFFGLIFKRKGISSRISQISQGSRRVASFLKCFQNDTTKLPLKYQIIDKIITKIN